MGCTKDTPRCELGCLLRKCCYEHIKETLFYTVDLLNEFKIHHWMDSGTLLGAMRGKDIIPWDNDADIGILAKDKDKFLALEDRVNNDGFYFYHYSDHMKEIRYSKENRCNTDIVFNWVIPAYKHKLWFERKKPAGKTAKFPEDYSPLLEDHIKDDIPIITSKLWGCQLNHTTDMPYWFVKKLERREIAGRKIACPRHPTKFLQFRYGDNWKFWYHWNSGEYPWGGNVYPLTYSLAYVKKQINKLD